MSSHGESQKRRTVPKFSSFKRAPEDNPAERSTNTTEETKGSSRHHHRHRERRHASSPKPDAVVVKEPESSQPPTDRLDGGDLFFLDKKGDHLILKYGSNDRSRVPSYRRFGRGRMMGSRQRFEIHVAGPREEWTFRGSHDGTSVFRDKYLAARLGRVKARRIKQETNGLPRGDEDFVQLMSSKKRKRQGESSDDELPNYRSIQGKANAKDFVDSDFESDSDSAPGEQDDQEVTAARALSIKLFRRTREHPEDLETWLKLIDLQDKLLQEDRGKADTPSAEEAKALADIKASLYEKALPHATSPAARERLLVGLMREGRKTWSAKILAQRWQDISKSDRDSPGLFRAQLDYELTNLSTFSFDGSKAAFVARIQSLKTQLFSESDETNIAASRHTIYIFSRMTRFLHDSGYAELAVAAWQAFLDMTFFRPSNVADFDAAKASFSEYWESEVPRLGEDMAQGWRHYATADTLPDAPDPREEQKPALPHTRDQYKAWALLEKHKAKQSRHPARTLDEGTDVDPFRVVMFSDIQELLIWLPTSVIQDVTPYLLDAYLAFCGLLPASVSATHAIPDSLADDAFMSGPRKDIEQAVGQASRAVDDSVDLSTHLPSFASGGARLVLSPDVLFAGPTWFQYFEGWKTSQDQDESSVDLGWVLSSLGQLAQHGGLEQLAVYYLGLSWIKDRSAARKVARTLLKQYPNHVALYNAYARIEWANQNLEVSHKVLASATAQTLGSSPLDSQMLWNTWAWLELEAGDRNKALARLCHSADPQAEISGEPSPSMILKARVSFGSNKDYSLSSMQLNRALDHAESLLLLEYLSAGSNTGPNSVGSQGDITAALASVASWSHELTLRQLGQSSYHELLLQSAARLLYYHATHGPFRPVDVRKQLESYLEIFPRNTLLLELFAWAESSLRINDPVRTLLRRAALVEPYDCVTSRRFAILHEIRMGTDHSVRAAFEAALASDTCRGNVPLWLDYIRFCYARKALRPKVRDVFYRAVAQCPWSKELYLEAFGTLAKEMNSAELKAVFSTITTYGLRVHVDMEEFVAAAKAKAKTEASRARMR